jgi:hypothetical protein
MDGLSDGLSQVALAGAARAEEERILAPADECAGGQIEDQAAVDLRVEGEVEVVEGLVRISEAGLLAPPFEQALMALRATNSHENGRAPGYAGTRREAGEVGTALEQLSPSASLIRNARQNQ